LFVTDPLVLSRKRIAVLVEEKIVPELTIVSAPALVIMTATPVLAVTDAPASLFSVPPPLTLIPTKSPEILPKFVMLIGVENDLIPQLSVPVPLIMPPALFVTELVTEESPARRMPDPVALFKPFSFNPIP
jgi:hypothetical protein